MLSTANKLTTAVLVKKVNGQLWIMIIWFKFSVLVSLTIHYKQLIPYVKPDWDALTLGLKHYNAIQFIGRGNLKKKWPLLNQPLMMPWDIKEVFRGSTLPAPLRPNNGTALFSEEHSKSVKTGINSTEMLLFAKSQTKSKVVTFFSFD